MHSPVTVLKSQYKIIVGISLTLLGESKRFSPKILEPYLRSFHLVDIEFGVRCTFVMILQNQRAKCARNLTRN